MVEKTPTRKKIYISGSLVSLEGCVTEMFYFVNERDGSDKDGLYSASGERLSLATSVSFV